MARIHLIRHGQTAWNAELVFRGRKDLPLSPFGEKQAEAVADGLAGEPIAAVYASPLVRAVQTVTPLAERFGAPVTVVDGLIDASFGEWEGKTVPQVQSRWPELFAAWTETPYGITFPGGEAFADVARRSTDAIRALAAKHDGETIAVCAHRLINKVVLSSLLGIVETGFWMIKQDTACTNSLTIDGDRIVIESLNDTRHLATLAGEREVDF